MIDERMPSRSDTVPRDTPPDARVKEYAILRCMDAAVRAAMTFELRDNLRSLVAAGVRHRRPDWDERAVDREVVRSIIGDALFHQAYGTGPAVA